MIDQAKLWFRSRSLREQKLLLVMAGLLVVTIIWGAIILPVTDGLATARARYDAAVVLVGETEQRAKDVKALEPEGTPTPTTDTYDGTVRARADAAGIALSSVGLVGSDGVQFSVASVRPGPLMAFVSRLEDEGLIVDTLTVADNGDKTVSAQVSLRVMGS
jgi:general secretion pathway protein M